MKDESAVFSEEEKERERDRETKRSTLDCKSIITFKLHKKNRFALLQNATKYNLKQNHENNYLIIQLKTNF